MPTTKLTAIKARITLSVLRQLVELDKTKSLSFAGSTRIRLSSLLTHLATFDEQIVEEANALVRKYGKPVDKEGKPIEGDALKSLPSEHQIRVQQNSAEWADFSKESEELMSSEFEFEFATLTAEELFNKRTVKDRGEDGKVATNEVENQIPIDFLSDLQSVGIVAKN